MEDYLTAKKDLKRDLIIFLSISVLLSIVATIFIVGYLLRNEDISFFDLVQLIIAGVLIGFFLSSAITGVILTFRFAWRTFSGLSLIFLIILVVIGYAFGWLITAVHYILGVMRVQKLGKIFQRYN